MYIETESYGGGDDGAIKVVTYSYNKTFAGARPVFRIFIDRAYMYASYTYDSMVYMYIRIYYVFYIGAYKLWGAREFSSLPLSADRSVEARA